MVMGRERESGNRVLLQSPHLSLLLCFGAFWTGEVSFEKIK